LTLCQGFLNHFGGFRNSRAIVKLSGKRSPHGGAFCCRYATLYFSPPIGKRGRKFILFSPASSPCVLRFFGKHHMLRLRGSHAVVVSEKSFVWRYKCGQDL